MRYVIERKSDGMPAVTWEGGQKNGKPHGYGFLRTDYGSIWEGELDEGMTIGVWIMRHNNGNITGVVMDEYGYTDKCYSIFHPIVEQLKGMSK